MTTKQRFRNKYRLEIREDDHPPMHAHLVGGSIDVLIDLQTLSCIGAFPRGLRDEVMAWVKANRVELIDETTSHSAKPINNIGKPLVMRSGKNGIHEAPPPVSG